MGLFYDSIETDAPIRTTLSSARRAAHVNLFLIRRGGATRPRGPRAGRGLVSTTDRLDRRRISIRKTKEKIM